MYYLSSTINPLLYQLMSAKFRLAFKETFKCSLFKCAIFNTSSQHRHNSANSPTHSLKDHSSTFVHAHSVCGHHNHHHHCHHHHHHPHCYLSRSAKAAALAAGRHLYRPLHKTKLHQTRRLLANGSATSLDRPLSSGLASDAPLASVQDDFGLGCGATTTMQPTQVNLARRLSRSFGSLLTRLNSTATGSATRNYEYCALCCQQQQRPQLRQQVISNVTLATQQTRSSAAAAPTETEAASAHMRRLVTPINLMSPEQVRSSSSLSAQPSQTNHTMLKFVRSPTPSCGHSLTRVSSREEDDDDGDNGCGGGKDNGNCTGEQPTRSSADNSGELSSDTSDGGGDDGSSASDSDESDGFGAKELCCDRTMQALISSASVDDYERPPSNDNDGLKSDSPEVVVEDCTFARAEERTVGSKSSAKVAAVTCSTSLLDRTLNRKASELSGSDRKSRGRRLSLQWSAAPLLKAIARNGFGGNSKNGLGGGAHNSKSRRRGSSASEWLDESDSLVQVRGERIDTGATGNESASNNGTTAQLLGSSVCSSLAGGNLSSGCESFAGASSTNVRLSFSTTATSTTTTTTTSALESFDLHAAAAAACAPEVDPRTASPAPIKKSQLRQDSSASDSAAESFELNDDNNGSGGPTTTHINHSASSVVVSPVVVLASSNVVRPSRPEVTQ